MRNKQYALMQITLGGGVVAEQNRVNWPQILGQFKQQPRLEFSSQDSAECAHYCNIQ